MMSGNSSGAASASAVGGDGRHDDDAALTEFLSSLMDYTPTVLLFFLRIFSKSLQILPNRHFLLRNRWNMLLYGSTYDYQIWLAIIREYSGKQEPFFVSFPLCCKIEQDQIGLLYQMVLLTHNETSQVQIYLYLSQFLGTE